MLLGGIVLNVIPLINILEEVNGEISQVGNINAYSRLLLLPKYRQVAKVCYKEHDLWRKNLKNLELICKRIDAKDFPEIVFPTHWLEYKGNIVGYLMPYIEGKTFDTILLQREISKQKVLLLFDKLSSIIQRLPNDVHLGDLHAKNIIVTNNDDVFLIDIDGFSVDSGYHLTCPLDYDINYFDNSLKSKYFNDDFTVKIGRNTDIYCLLKIFLTWLLNDINPIRFSIRRRLLFFEYLLKKGVPYQVIDMISMAFKEDDNYLVDLPFKHFSKVIDNISYEDYLSTMDLQVEEDQYLKYINQLIEENKNG